MARNISKHLQNYSRKQFEKRKYPKKSLGNIERM